MRRISSLQLTPVEHRGQLYFKREDLYTQAGAHGGKVRTCYSLAKGARGIICAASRKSPQLCYVSAIARGLRIPCLLFTASGAETEEMEYAKHCGAEIVQIRPGYSNVVLSRAKAEAERREPLGWRMIPFGMECQEAVDATAQQVANIPMNCKRIVAIAGSGMTLAGILKGLADRGRASLPVLGVMIGSDPSNRLDLWAKGWRMRPVALVHCGFPYTKEVEENIIEGIVLDPLYEAKCLPYLKPRDLFWVVGARPAIKTPNWRDE